MHTICVLSHIYSVYVDSKVRERMRRKSVVYGEWREEGEGRREGLTKATLIS